jgi:hypothetical protein
MSTKAKKLETKAETKKKTLKPKKQKTLTTARFTPSSDLHVFLRERKALHSTESKLADEEDLEISFLQALMMLKGVVFKADRPYRCILGSMSSISTSAAGVLGYALGVSSVANVTEWSSISALFDECFVHSMTVHFAPLNLLSGGQGLVVAGTAGNAVSTAANPGTVFNTGAIWVSIFNGAASYGTAAQMLPNPTRRLVHTGKPHSYSWRNNVRFDARGPALSSGTTEAWQGWTLLSNIANYGGSVNARAYGDRVIGNGAAAVVLADISLTYDVSFRARA